VRFRGRVEKIRAMRFRSGVKLPRMHVKSPIESSTRRDLIPISCLASRFSVQHPIEHPRLDKREERRKGKGEGTRAKVWLKREGWPPSSFPRSRGGFRAGKGIREEHDADTYRKEGRKEGSEQERGNIVRAFSFAIPRHPPRRSRRVRLAALVAAAVVGRMSIFECAAQAEQCRAAAPRV